MKFDVKYSVILALGTAVMSFNTYAADEAQQIRAAINHDFDRPDAVVVSDPVVIEQGYAVADWIQGDKGGRALLKSNHGHWSIVLCSGDALKQAENIRKAGVPSKIAELLADKLTTEESNLPATKVELFGRFGTEQRQHEIDHGMSTR